MPFGLGSNDERALHGNEHTDHRNQEGSQGKSVFNNSIVHLLSSMCVAACGCQLFDLLLTAIAQTVPKQERYKKQKLA